jgi:hypothetical protein
MIFFCRQTMAKTVDILQSVCSMQLWVWGGGGFFNILKQQTRPEQPFCTPTVAYLDILQQQPISLPYPADNRHLPKRTWPLNWSVHCTFRMVSACVVVWIARCGKEGTEFAAAIAVRYSWVRCTVALYVMVCGGTLWRSWLRHCATSWKILGCSIPDGVTGFFHWLNPSAALWPGVDSASTRNQYQEYFLRGKGGRCIRLTTLPPSMFQLPWNLGAWTFWNHQGLSCPGLYMDCITFTFWCRPVGRPNSVSKKLVVPPHGSPLLGLLNVGTCVPIYTAS